MAPKFSIIINSYNRLDSLLTTIESVLKQSYTDFELIIVDDGSTDNTERKLKSHEYRNKFVYVKQKNMGCPSSRNTGIFKAKGEYISFLDSDIICSPDWLYNVWEVMTQREDIDILGTIPIPGEFVKQLKLMKSIGPTVQKRIAEVSQVGGGVSTIRRNVFNKIGILDEAGKFGYLEDTEFCWRAVLNGLKVCYLYDILTFHMKDNTEGSRLKIDILNFEKIKNKYYLMLKLMDKKTIYIYFMKEFLKSIILIFKNQKNFIPLIKSAIWIYKNRYGIIHNRINTRKTFITDIETIKRLQKTEREMDKINQEYFLKILKE